MKKQGVITSNQLLRPMKKFSLLVFVTLYSFGLCYSQEKGNWLVGGSFGYASDKTEDQYSVSESSDFTFVPVVGYMLTDQFAVGLESRYSSSLNSWRSLSIAPFVRYHKNMNENLRFYVESSFRRNFILKDLSDNSDHKPKAYTATIDVGLLYFISSRISLELNVASASYSHIKDEDDEDVANLWRVSSSLADPQIGLKYYF